MKHITLLFFLAVFSISAFAQDEYAAFRFKLNNKSDSYLYSQNDYGKYQLIGTYPGWDKEAIYIAGYNNTNLSSIATKRVYIGKSIVFELSNASLGIGTTNPQAKLHLSSAQISQNSIARFDANMIIEGTGNGRTLTNGAALGFVVPADTNGGNAWQQGRILVTPDNEANHNACGRMLLQARYLDGSQWKWRDNLVLKSNGNVGVGTISPKAKLDVAGTIKATEIKVEAQTADFVFEEDYTLKDLSEVESFIKENKHLPDIPSAKEMEASGVNLAEMNKLLLQKVEELTLYLIEKEDEVKALKQLREYDQAKSNVLETQMQLLVKRLDTIETLLK